MASPATLIQSPSGAVGRRSSAAAAVSSRAPTARAVARCRRPWPTPSASVMRRGAASWGAPRATLAQPRAVVNRVFGPLVVLPPPAVRDESRAEALIFIAMPAVFPPVPEG